MRNHNADSIRSTWLSALAVTLVAMTAFLPTPLQTATASHPAYFFEASAGASLATCFTVCSAANAAAYPATILNAAQNAKVFAVLPSGGKRGIVGGTRFVGNESIFRWVAGPLGLEDGGLGRPFYIGKTNAAGRCADGAFCNWRAASAQPDNTNGNEGNVEILWSFNGYWNDVADAVASNDGCFCQLDLTTTWSPSAGNSATVACRTFSESMTQERTTRTASVRGVSRSATMIPTMTLTNTRSATMTRSESLTTTRSATMAQTALTFSRSVTFAISASVSHTRSVSASEDLTRSRTLASTPTPTLVASPSLSFSVLSQNITVNPTISGTSSITSTRTPTVTASATKSRTQTRSILQSETLRDPGVVMVNTTVRGVFLSVPAPSGLWNESFVVTELMLAGTEFSPFFDRSSVNCFANVSDSLVIKPMDGVAAIAVRALVASTTIVRVISDTHALVFLKADNAVYGSLARQTVIGIGLRGACLARSYLTLHGELPIEATIGDPAQSSILANTGAVTTAVGVLNPVVAVQAQRNSLALSIQFCEADDGSIGILRSPTTLALGDSSVAAYVGGAAMNHVVVLAMLIIMSFIAWVRLLGVGGTLMDALSTIRCPGPVAFPILLLIEPTATCAIITILFAEGKLVAIGFVSMALCVSYPIVMIGYLLRGFKAERRQSFDTVESVEATGSTRFERFMFGKGKWIDDPTISGSKGFCRRNGYFFKEYREGRHWFLGIEVILSVAIGSLQGIKLGYGQCQGVLYAMTAVLSTYMISFFILRPCVSPFANLYVLTLTSMQITGCVLLCFPPDANRTAIAVELSAVGSYLVLLKSAVDFGELVIESIRSCKKYRDHREERRLAVLHAHSLVEAKSSVEVPAALLKQPISILARRSRELGAEYPAAKESGVLELLDGGMYERRGDVLAALEAVCADNVASMKRVAAHKEALDGVWRDWREEAMRVPIEMVALAVQLREVEATIRASEASRVSLRDPIKVSEKAVRYANLNSSSKGRDVTEDTNMLEDYLDPMLHAENDDGYYDDVDVELDDLGNPPLFVLPADAPAVRPAVYGINSEGYLVVDDEEEFARDAEYFPEI
jgi:hypothetical protein